MSLLKVWQNVWTLHKWFSLVSCFDQLGSMIRDGPLEKWWGWGRFCFASKLFRFSMCVFFPFLCVRFSACSSCMHFLKFSWIFLGWIFFPHPVLRFLSLSCYEILTAMVCQFIQAMCTLICCLTGCRNGLPEDKELWQIIFPLPDNWKPWKTQQDDQDW